MRDKERKKFRQKLNNCQSDSLEGPRVVWPDVTRSGQCWHNIIEE